MLAFAVPESARAARDALRAALTRLGAAPIQGGPLRQRQRLGAVHGSPRTRPQPPRPRIFPDHQRPAAGRQSRPRGARPRLVAASRDRRRVPSNSPPSSRARWSPTHCRRPNCSHSPGPAHTPANSSRSALRRRARQVTASG
ncbi:hypothetical protein ACFRK5_18000 [Streptomyces niveus]|uniref:hypothetical protein n=1 Tax=Streptomyces niveus TaxID=193462 RepID=UPI00369E406D